MSIIIIGDISISKEITIIPSSILKGQSLKTEVETGIVGSPEVIRVRTSNPPETP